MKVEPAGLLGLAVMIQQPDSYWCLVLFLSNRTSVPALFIVSTLGNDPRIIANVTRPK